MRGLADARVALEIAYDGGQQLMAILQRSITANQYPR